MNGRKLNNKKQVKETVESLKNKIEQQKESVQMQKNLNEQNGKVIPAEIELAELKLADDNFMPIEPKYKFETHPKYLELNRIIIADDVKTFKAKRTQELEDGINMLKVHEQILTNLQSRLAELEKATGGNK